MEHSCKTGSQQNHNEEKGLVLQTLFWGNKHLCTGEQAYVSPYLFSLGYCLLRFSENPIPSMGLSTWTGEVVTFTIPRS